MGLSSRTNNGREKSIFMSLTTIAVVVQILETTHREGYWLCANDAGDAAGRSRLWIGGGGRLDGFRRWQEMTGVDDVGVEGTLDS